MIEDTYPQNPLRSPNGVSPEDVRHQLERILCSNAFCNARYLRGFLEYVTLKMVGGLSDEIKEYWIGREVFNRPETYDPKVDTVVRVQAHRLRAKLEEYYAHEGATDELVVEIPKGRYVPHFFRRAGQPVTSEESEHAGADSLSSEPSAEDIVKLRAPEQQAGARAKRAIPKIRIRLAALALVTAGLTLMLSRSRLGRTSLPEGPTGDDDAFRTLAEPPLTALWSDFTKTDNAPIIAYSNAVFLATETSDLLRVKTANVVGDLGVGASGGIAQKLADNPVLLRRAGKVFFDPVYTGTGEVMGVFYLTRMFEPLRVNLTVKRSLLITTDDLLHHSVIFLGSSRENAVLARLPLTQDFVFGFAQKPQSFWNARLLNLHPHPGESASYALARDPASGALGTDYAVVSFLPGMAPNRRIVVLAGLTTLGTQAAAEFVTSRFQTAGLANRLMPGWASASAKMPRFFQFVLRIEILKGDILNVKYITGHVLRPACSMKSARAGN
jgi:hypothetical protein